MGFAANQARLMFLIAEQNDLEFDAQLKQAQLERLGAESMQLEGMESRLDAGSKDRPNPAYAQVDATIRQLEQTSKLLEMKLHELDNKRDANMKQQESLQNMIKQNIKSSFGVVGGQQGGGGGGY